MSFFAACGMLERTSWISLPAFPRLRKAHCFECHSFHRNEVRKQRALRKFQIPCCLLSIAVLFMNIQRVLTCLMSPTCVCRQASTSSKDCSLPIDLPVPTSFLANLAQKNCHRPSGTVFRGQWGNAMMILQRSLHRVSCIGTVFLCSMS